MEEFNMDDLDLNFKRPRKGDVVEGEVISIRDDNTIYVDIQSFTEGTMYLDHYTNDKNVTSFKGLVKVGDKITCTVTKVTEDNVYLSRLNQINEEGFKKVIDAKNDGTLITVKVTDSIENKGFKCEFEGAKIFLPKSQATSSVEVGKEIEVKVIDIDEKRKSAIVSRKEVENDEYQNNRNKEYDTINEGDVLKGTIIRVEKYGALVKFNYLTGLLRTVQVSHKFIDIEKELNVGDEIEVKVIKKENGKIELSRKALLDTPFAIYIKNHKVSDTVKGKVTEKLPYGLLVQLADDVKGLLHRTEYSHNPNDNFNNCVKINDEIEVSIIAIDEAKERISLSRKPLLDNPWERVEGKVGDIVDAKIAEINEKGLKVEALGVDGFVPMSEASLEKANLNDLYQVGDVAKAVITEIKPKEWRLKLSIKKVLESEAKAEYEKHLTTEEDSATIGDRFEDVLKDNK
ncbi:MAG: 30S ribosomal protein S1 [Acholeplasmatales bacterium]|nr:30S ribosomal protein S1 [Acholeplasmatales bacterium]